LSHASDPTLGAARRSPVPSSRHLSWTKVVIFSVVPVMVLLAVGEIGLRVWAYWFRTPYERYNPSSGRLELVPNLHYTNTQGLEFRINSRGFLGPEFDQVKPPGVYRIFAVGDSCTFGTGFWNQTYPALVGRILGADAGAGRYEVINAGIEGYNSEFALDRIRQELLAYHPDMVILYIGWNDLMKIDPRNAAATGRYVGLARVLERSYLVKAYGKVLFYHLRPRLMKPRIGPDPDGTLALADFVPVRYRMNLEAAVELLQKNGTTPVIVTLPTVVTADMTPDDLERARVFFPYYPAGYGVEAFLRLHMAYNDVIRQTAAKYSLPLVDLEAVLGGPARRELFWDTMHPSLKGHRLIADAIAQTVRDARRATTNRGRRNVPLRPSRAPRLDCQVSQARCADQLARAENSS
jgi:lysophospholipase L1-like esterase